MIRRVFVANRGEIALRIVEACHALDLEAVVGTSKIDRDTLPARRADRAVTLGPDPAPQSYLAVDTVLAAALGTGCDALHPGYGFLSESADFARRVTEEGLTWVGPSSKVIAAAGDKARAREAAVEADVPTLEGSPVLEEPDDAVQAAEELGYPVLVKAVAGGGGRGMSVAEDERALRRRFVSAAEEARQAFGDGRLYVERYVRSARHVEVQLLGDGHGGLVELGERDCTLQRRHQKIVEEAPATALAEGTREQIRNSALAFGRQVGLDSAATAEFIYDNEREDFAFLELNARIQVEHPVTELVTGTDLVAAQLRVAGGGAVEIEQEKVELRGHALECRITAEAADRGFAPCPGRLTAWHAPEAQDGLRIDTHCEADTMIPPHYDALMAKVVVHADDREAALERMDAALAQLRIEGVQTTVDFQRFVLGHEDFRSGEVDTRWVEDHGLPAYLERAEAA